MLAKSVRALSLECKKMNARVNQRENPKRTTMPACLPSLSQKATHTC